MKLGMKYLDLASAFCASLAGGLLLVLIGLCSFVSPAAAVNETMPQVCHEARDQMTEIACDGARMQCIFDTSQSPDFQQGSSEDRDRIFTACIARYVKAYEDGQKPQKRQQKSDSGSGCSANAADEETAIAACTAVIQSGGASPAKLSRAYFWRGASYAQKDNARQAMVDFGESIRLNPNQRDAYDFRGILYLDKGWYTEALINSDEAIKHDPANAKAYWERGAAHMKQSEPDKALPDFEMAVKFNPNDPDNWDALGTAKKKLGRVEEGERDIAKSRTMKPVHTVFR